MDRPLRVERGLLATPAGQLHYFRAGGGKPLLLLHTTGLSASSYLPLLAYLGPRNVYAVDLPGCGFSDPIPRTPDGLFTIEACADAVAAFMTAAGVGRMDVFGLHLGNKVAAALAARHPELVRCCAFAGHTHSIVLDNAARNGTFPAFEKLAEAAARARDGEQWPSVREWEELWPQIESFWRGGMAAGMPTDAADLRRARDEVIARLLGGPSYGLYYAANFAFDLARALELVEARSLVVELRVPEDAHIPPQGPLWQRSLRDCRFATIEMDSRTLLYRHPEALGQQLDAFFG